MAKSSARVRRLLDAYRFPGCRAKAAIKGVFGDPKARVIALERRAKKPSADVADVFSSVGTTTVFDAYATCPVATLGSISTSWSGVWPAQLAAR
jgi:hypothetical protein